MEYHAGFVYFFLGRFGDKIRLKNRVEKKKKSGYADMMGYEVYLWNAP